MEDIFHTTYRELNESEQYHIKLMKECASQLLSYLKVDNEKGQREMALSRTKLEESIMWAVKAITI